MGRSLRVHPYYIDRVKLAVKRSGFPNQKMLAVDVGLAKATVVNFLNGRPVDFLNFQEICEKLSLDWQEVADLGSSGENDRAEDFSLDAIAPAIKSSARSSAGLAFEPAIGIWDDEFYVERPPVEALCHTILEEPGALIRIKAPRQMGKTALLSKIMHQAIVLQYGVASISFQLADQTVLANLNTFLRWFCAVVTKELGLVNRIDEYWEDILACNFNTTLYFQKYLLPQLSVPLVLAIDNADLVFEQPQIATDFCRLLRNWYDQARRSDRTSQTWQKLRLVIVHATEIYSSLDINSSPLAGVGTIIELPEFTPQQAQELIQNNGIDWTIAEMQQLLDLVGGHPYLLQHTLHCIKRWDMTLDQVFEDACTEAGIYRDHLRQNWEHLRQSPELAEVFKRIVNSEEPVALRAADAFKLHSMGLIKLHNNDAEPRCRLYQIYFRECFRNL